MKTEDVMFRRAVAEDLAAIIALIADDQLGQQREDPSLPLAGTYLKAFAAIEADANQILAVAVGGGVVVGTLQLTFIPGLARRGAWRGQIEAVRIARIHRGGGLGQSLMEWAIAACKARGCNLVQLTSDKARGDAHRFYERLGFKASHEGYKRAI